MPKISGLGLGEIKKISGVGIGNIKKVSGLGVGLIWQDAVEQGMTKNGSFSLTTSQQTVSGWLPEPNSSVSGSSLIIPSAGNWILSANINCAASGFSGSCWIQLFIYRSGSGTAAVTGPQEPVNRGGSEFIPISSNTPIACADGEQITLQARAQFSNVGSIANDPSSWLRAIPV